MTDLTGPGTSAECIRHEKEIDRLRATVSVREEAVAAIEKAVAHIEGRLPEKLGESLILISLKLDNAIRDISDLKSLVRADLVNRAEFDPIKKIVYGMVGLILTAVVVALIALVVKKP